MFLAVLLASWLDVCNRPRRTEVCEWCWESQASLTTEKTVRTVCHKFSGVLKNQTALFVYISKRRCVDGFVRGPFYIQMESRPQIMQKGLRTSSVHGKNSLTQKCMRKILIWYLTLIHCDVYICIIILLILEHQYVNRMLIFFSLFYIWKGKQT